MTALRIPVLVVTGSYLGTISHTLDGAACAGAAQARHLRHRGQRKRARQPRPLDETVATIGRFARSIDVIGLPAWAGDAEPHPAFERIAALL